MHIALICTWGLGVYFDYITNEYEQIWFDVSGIGLMYICVASLMHYWILHRIILRIILRAVVDLQHNFLRKYKFKQ